MDDLRYRLWVREDNSVALVNSIERAILWRISPFHVRFKNDRKRAISEQMKVTDNGR